MTPGTADDFLIAHSTRSGPRRTSPGEAGPPSNPAALGGHLVRAAEEPEERDDDLESTADLFGRIRAGDVRARETLLRRYWPILKRMAHGRLPLRARGLADTDDLVQSTLISAFNHVEQFEPRRAGAFHAYLRQILANKVVDVIRQVNRIPDHEPIPDSFADGGRSPFEEYIGKEQLAAYEAALEKLNPQQQEAVIMRVEFGFTYPVIAREIGSPSANAVRMLIERALVTLAKAMKHVQETS